MSRNDASDRPPFPSPVYRQIVTAEIVWTDDGEQRDWGGVIRDAIMGDAWPAWPGQIIVCDLETLAPPSPPVGAGDEHTPSEAEPSVYGPATRRRA